MQKPGNYEKTFTRDFSLGLLEIWGDSETVDKPLWCDKPCPVTPYLMFEKTPDTVNVFMDPVGIDWHKEKLASMLKKNPTFPQKVIDEFGRYMNPMKQFLESDYIFDLQQLDKAARTHRKEWNWFVPLWWLIELFEEQGLSPDTPQQLSSLLAVRKETESFAVKEDVLITRSIAKAYPRLRKYARVIRLKEAVSGKIPGKKDLDARLKGFWYAKKRLYVGATGADMEKRFKIRILREKIAKSQIMVLGQIGFQGIVQGLVCKIMAPSDMVKWDYMVKLDFGVWILVEPIQLFEPPKCHTP